MASDPHPWPRLLDQRGSVLMLMPAAALIVIILGSLAIDQAIVFGAQRDLVATAQAVANDAAGLAVDVDRLRADGTVDLDEAAIDRVVTAAVARADGAVTARWELRNGLVVVHLQRTVPLVFARGVPGAARSRKVAAVAEAELRRN